MQRYTKYPKHQTFFKYFTMISVKTLLYLTDKANKFTKLLQKTKSKQALTTDLG